ncbi:MAG: hypothetical protein R3E42_01430 [Burkholderiaceae bacterium]
MAALWAGAVGAAQAAPTPVVGRRSQRIVVAASNKMAFCYLPLTIASRLGFFEAEGVSLELREYADVSAGIRACLDGSAHMLSGPYASTLVMRTQGELFSSFLLQGLAPQIVLGASHHTMQSYRSARDLRGDASASPRWVLPVTALHVWLCLARVWPRPMCGSCP